MRTAENAPGTGERRWVWAGLAAVLAGGLALRLWGVRQGLPYVYNVDEATHFVTHAVQMFGGGLNPHYFANPPGFTYLLHGVFALWYGGGSAAQRALEGDPAGIFTLARVASALLGTIALWLLYLTGARLFSRPAGLLAAAILAVAFLPVFYAHASSPAGRESSRAPVRYSSHSAIVPSTAEATRARVNIPVGLPSSARCAAEPPPYQRANRPCRRYVKPGGLAK